jgi:hypothetical protein
MFLYLIQLHYCVFLISVLRDVRSTDPFTSIAPSYDFDQILTSDNRYVAHKNNMIVRISTIQDLRLPII